MVPDLDRVLAAASRCDVFDAGISRGQPLAKQPVLTVQGPDLAQLRSLLRADDNGGGVCMCQGEATLRFSDGMGRVLATIGLHHAASLRWEQWDADRELADGPALARWLAARGLAGPLELLHISRARAAADAATRQDWSQAVPEPVRPLLTRMLAASQTGMISPELLGQLRQDLALAWPDDTGRCRVLLAWFSAGTGRYSGFPVHEAIPGLLLTELPITTVIQALRHDQADERAWRGAARHLAAWRARTAQELRSVPESMRPQLLAVAERQDETQACRLRESWQPPR